MVVNGGVESVILKARHGSDMRKLSLRHNHDLAFNDLVLMMQRVFKLKSSTPLVLKYRDQDGDLITLTDDDDLGLALRTENVLRIEVMEGSSESSATSRALHDHLVSLKSSATAVMDALASHGQPEPPAVFGVGSRSRPDTPTTQHEAVLAPVATIQPTVHEQVNNPSHPPPPTEFAPCDIPLPPFSAMSSVAHTENFQTHPAPPPYMSSPALTQPPTSNFNQQAPPTSVYGNVNLASTPTPQPPSMSPQQYNYAPTSMPNSVPQYGGGQPGYGNMNSYGMGGQDHQQAQQMPPMAPQPTSVAPPVVSYATSMAPSAPQPNSFAAPPISSYVPAPPTGFGSPMQMPPTGMPAMGGANPFARGVSPGAPHQFVRPAFSQQQQHPH